MSESDGFEAEDEWREWRNAARANDHLRVGGPVALGDAVAGKLGADASENEPVTLPCKQCGTPLEIKRYFYDWVKTTGSHVVATKGEPPIDDGEIARCADCHAAWHAKKLEEAMALDEEVGKLHRQVKDGRDLRPDQIRWLRGHGYIATAQAIEDLMRERRDGPNEAQRSSGERGSRPRAYRSTGNGSGPVPD